MIDNFREWLSDNLRYIMLGLAVVLVIIIGVCIFRLIGGSSSSKKKETGKKTTAVTTSQKDEKSTESSGSGSVPKASVNLTQDDPDLLALTQKYYKAVAAKDSATLATIVDPWNDTVQSETFSSDIENYNNISTYSKDGPVDDSSLVYVYCECKLPNISTAVPSLRQLFVTKNDSGDLVISDWSQYQDFVTDSNKSEDVQSLIREVNAKCQQLAETDEDLKAYLLNLRVSVPPARIQPNRIPPAALPLTTLRFPAEPQSQQTASMYERKEAPTEQCLQHSIPDRKSMWFPPRVTGRISHLRILPQAVRSTDMYRHSTCSSAAAAAVHPHRDPLRRPQHRMLRQTLLHNI